MKLRSIFLISIISILCFAFLGCEATQGREIEDTYINEDGELIMVYSDGEEENLGPIASADSLTIEDTFINEIGELIIVYSNGESKNLGVVVGKDGKDGENGKDGKDGENGKDGADGKDGKDGKDGLDGTVSGSTGSNVGASVSKATRSAVSIIAKFVDIFDTESASAGSGVIYKYDEESDGYFIITNYHVVYDSSFGVSDDIRVYLYGNEYAEGAINAKYIGGSLNYDIAVLHIENNDIFKASCAVAVETAPSSTVSIGDTAIAVGNARGEGISATAGVVSVDSESIEMTGADGKTPVTFRVMRTDTPINRGNSGGGLFNDKGQLIGIVNAKIIVEGVEGIGYAIPSTLALNVADNIIDNCYGKSEKTVKRALLGISVSIIESSSVLDPSTGKIGIKEKVYVVQANSNNLFGTQIMANDVIKSIKLDRLEKITVTRQFHVIDYLLQARVNDTGVLTVERETSPGQWEEVELSFTITESCIANY